MTFISAIFVDSIYMLIYNIVCLFLTYFTV